MNVQNRNPQASQTGISAEPQQASACVTTTVTCPPDQPTPLSVKVATLKDLGDTSRLRDDLENGNVVIVDIGQFMTDKIAYERVLKDLKDLAREVDGDLLGLGDQRTVVITPRSVKISRIPLADGGPCSATGMTECSGACVDLLTDPHHCGSCTQDCGEFDVCSGGVCVPPTGFAPVH